MSLVSMLAEIQKILVSLEELWLHLLVMTGRVVFHPIVCQFSLTRLTEEAELVLVDTAITKPVILHVHGFGSFGMEMTVDNIVGSAVVCLDGCMGIEDVPIPAICCIFQPIVCTDIWCTKFCFGS